MRTLTPEEAKSFYDHFGTKQDRQGFYEAPALDALVAAAAFEGARSVFEFGCGTGRFALELLERHLPPDAHYLGIDLSTTMVQIASERLARFGSRATVAPALGGSPCVLPPDESSVDRFVSTYVLDLLPEAAIHEVLGEAQRVLVPTGLLCLVGVTHGTTLSSRLVMGAWQRIFARRPSWVGGCRPTTLTEHLPPSSWEIRSHTVVVAWGVASEVLVAAPRASARAAA